MREMNLSASILPKTFGKQLQTCCPDFLCFINAFGFKVGIRTDQRSKYP
jgi:hypothetical protein